MHDRATTLLGHHTEFIPSEATNVDIRMHAARTQADVGAVRFHREGIRWAIDGSQRHNQRLAVRQPPEAVDTRAPTVAGAAVPTKQERSVNNKPTDPLCDQPTVWP